MDLNIIKVYGIIFVFVVLLVLLFIYTGKSDKKAYQARLYITKSGKRVCYLRGYICVVDTINKELNDYNIVSGVMLFDINNKFSFTVSESIFSEMFILKSEYDKINQL